MDNEIQITPNITTPDFLYGGNPPPTQTKTRRRKVNDHTQNPINDPPVVQSDSNTKPDSNTNHNTPPPVDTKVSGSNEKWFAQNNLLIIGIIVIAIILILGILYFAKQQENDKNDVASADAIVNDIDSDAVAHQQKIAEEQKRLLEEETRKKQIETMNAQRILEQNKIRQERIKQEQESVQHESEVNENITKRNLYYQQQIPPVTKSEDTTISSESDDDADIDNISTGSVSSPDSVNRIAGNTKKKATDFTQNEKRIIVKECANGTKKAVQSKYNLTAYQLNKIIDEHKKYYNKLKNESDN